MSDDIFEKLKIVESVKNRTIHNLDSVDEENTLEGYLFHLSEEVGEVYLAAKEYKRKPNEANKAHFVYELVDVQLMSESIISKYYPKWERRDSIRADVVQANKNVYGCKNQKGKLWGLYHDENGDRKKIVLEDVYEDYDLLMKDLNKNLIVDRDNGINVDYIVRELVPASEKVFHNTNSHDNPQERRREWFNATHDNLLG